VPLPKWNYKRVREVLKESFPFALLVLLMSFYYRTDTVMLERMLPDGAYHAGVYAQGFRFFESLNMLGYLFAGLLLPMFSRMLKEGSDTGPLAGLAWRLVLTGTIAVAAFSSAYAEEVLHLRYGANTEPTAPAAFAVMIWSFVAVCTTYVFGTLLTASGDLGALNRMAAAGMVLNIGLNWFLIPRFAALGAAWAGAVTQGATAIVQALLAARRFRFKPRPLHATGLVLYTLAMICVSFGAAAMDVPLIGAFAAVCGTGLVVVLLMRILPLGALRTLMIRQREP
jgi:O-antigen/teichoic acid export membrane protein